MPVDLDGRESAELPLQVALWDAIDEVVAASGGSTTNVGVARQKAVVRVHDALRPLADELLALRARVAEVERDAQLVSETRAAWKDLDPVVRETTTGAFRVGLAAVRHFEAEEATEALRAEEGGEHG